jgi:hypothetical protein
MSTAASSRYTVTCPSCNAEPGEPCRTLKTGRVTDTHTHRIWKQHGVDRTKGAR